MRNEKMSASFSWPEVKSGQGPPLSKLGYPEGWSDRPTISRPSLPHYSHGSRDKSGPVKANDKKTESFMILQCAIMCLATQKILLGIHCTASLIGPPKDFEKIMYCPKFESFQNNSYQASSKTVIPKTI